MEIMFNKSNCCSEKPIIALYSGEKLCKQHFNDYFENKVFKTIRQFDLIDKEENLGVALSGGKDSLTVLHILNRLSRQNPKIKINAIAIAFIFIFRFCCDNLFRMCKTVNESFPPEIATPRFSSLPIKSNCLIVLNTLFSK